jgi:hypothetical protein
VRWRRTSIPKNFPSGMDQARIRRKEERATPDCRKSVQVLYIGRHSAFRHSAFGHKAELKTKQRSIDQTWEFCK